MSKLLAGILMVVCLMGCDNIQHLFQKDVRGQSIDLVRKYLGASSCEERFSTIYNAKGNKADFNSHYSRGVCKTEYLSIPENKITCGDKGCSLWVVFSKDKNSFGVEIETGTWYATRVDNGEVKIDWRCSLGYNPINLKAFKAAHKAGESEVFRVAGELGSGSDTCSYSERCSKDLEIRFRDEIEGQWNDYIIGHVVKDSANGKRLFDALKDGQEHYLIVRLTYPTPKTYRGHIWEKMSIEDGYSSDTHIVDIISTDGWDEKKEEFAR